MAELRKSLKPSVDLSGGIFRYTLRIVATLFVLWCISGIYQYLTVTPEKLFTDKFKEFKFHDAPGLSKTAIQDLYEKGKMMEAVRLFDLLENPSPADYFLAGNAYLVLRQSARAIETFNSLIQLNLANGNHFYEKETEYYIGLSYLANADPANALPFFRKIYNDPDHPYRSSINNWFLQKVKRTI